MKFNSQFPKVFKQLEDHDPCNSEEFAQILNYRKLVEQKTANVTANIFKMKYYENYGPMLNIFSVLIYEKFDIFEFNTGVILTPIKLILLQIDSLNAAYFRIDLLITKLNINLE
ncbi:hypothetical protein BpHYR1_023349 [Brachionus plicatilis]|uniref:Uncharacterized protein n=1 Tax=Brachionus plicatilis TaxID=10195 RepID=A0A3M7SKG1_BRAPC|nr:hypothetical protein BpHYR1_023349 [Brachionus plicatilis]